MVNNSSAYISNGCTAIIDIIHVLIIVDWLTLRSIYIFNFLWVTDPFTIITVFERKLRLRRDRRSNNRTGTIYRVVCTLVKQCQKQEIVPKLCDVVNT